MSTPASGAKPATYDDLLKVPDTKVAEIIDGELIVSPRPAAPHAIASSGLGFDLGGPFDRGRGGPGGWWILFEPELHLGRDILVPDLAGWRRERMPEKPQVAFFELAPDWVCEVISPSSMGIDRVRKLRIYARERIPHAWILDPLARTLEVYLFEMDHYSVIGQHADDALVRAPPFDAIELDLLPLWGEQRAPVKGEAR